MNSNYIFSADFSTAVERTMRSEGFANLNDLIFLIWLKIKNVLVINLIKYPSTPLRMTNRERFYAFKNERLPCLLPTQTVEQSLHFLSIEQVINNFPKFDAIEPCNRKVHQG